MSKKSVQTDIDLKTLAMELRQIASQLEQGVIEVEGATVAVGEPLFLKTKRKVKEERAYFTLAFKVPLTQAAPGTITPAPARRQSPAAEMPPAGRSMKKEIARLWKEVSGRINANAQPGESDTAKLRRLLDEYRLYTPAAWATDWQACGAAVNRCLDAAMAGDLATARALVDSVNQQTRNCHRLHK